METKGLMKTSFEHLPFLGSGKVRDIYEVDGFLLIIATDRISAFDVVMPNPIPGKGEILTRMSAFWFRKMEDIIKNHLISTDPLAYPETCRPYDEILHGRSMLVRKAVPLPVECIIRGYLSGSGWKDYQESGMVSGITLPNGLRESDRLSEPIFTPSTKAEAGQHDISITANDVVNMIGREMAQRIIEKSILIYQRAEKIASEKGIIIADTKMEFGMIDGELILIDELLTPDSSRFWPKDDYQAGRPQSSFDKQFLRDYLLSLDWDQRPPAPKLPPHIIERTREKYKEALQRLFADE